MDSITRLDNAFSSSDMQWNVWLKYLNVVSKFHKKIIKTLNILTIFAMLGLIQSDIIHLDNMYSDLCDWRTTKTH